jgi:formate dehydrogenase subunit delta
VAGPHSGRAQRETQPGDAERLTGTRGAMNIERLVAMTNDIAAFFASEPDPDAAAEQVANHLRKFWEPRMREAIRRFVQEGGTGLSALAKRGIQQL